MRELNYFFIKPKSFFLLGVHANIVRLWIENMNASVVMKLYKSRIKTMRFLNTSSQASGTIVQQMTQASVQSVQIVACCKLLGLVQAAILKSSIRRSRAQSKQAYCIPPPCAMVLGRSQQGNSGCSSILYCYLYLCTLSTTRQ